MRKYTIGFLLLLLLSCTKSSNQVTNPPPIIPIIPVTPEPLPPGCYIVAAADLGPSGDTVDKYSFEYDSDGRLKGSTFTGPYSATVTYSYSGKTIYRNYSSGGTSTVDTILLNDAGLKIYDKSNNGSNTFVYNLEYDSFMQLKTFTTQKDGDPTDTLRYLWSNDDNIRIKLKNIVDTLIYDTSRLTVPGNREEFYQLLSLGAYFIKNKHLLISQNQQGHLMEYTYSFNSSGSITTISTTTNGIYSGQIVYTWECH